MIAWFRILTIAAVAGLSLAACQVDGGEAAPAPAPVGRAPSAEGGICAGIAGFRCQEGLYCAMSPEMQEAADGAGVCKKRPQMCTREYRPVCGADGKTYGNACTAASAGVSVAHAGECKG